MKTKIKNYFKWLFTRWYLYVLTFTFFIISFGGEYVGKGLTSRTPELILGGLFGDFLWWCLIISFCVGIKKLYLKLSKN